MIQKEPLDGRALLQLEQAARGNGTDKHLYKAFMLLRYTGMHVSVIYEPRFELHEETDEKGRVLVVWKRPKKVGGWARTHIKKHKNIDFNIDQYAKKAQVFRKKNKRHYYYYQIRKLGIITGLSKPISPNTLRHSLAIELLNAGWPESRVAQLLNVSKSTMKWYARYTDQGLTDQLEVLGW